MSDSRRLPLLTIAFGLLLVLHNDLWLQNDGSLWLRGLLPASLAYHVAYCLVAAALLTATVRWAWPTELEETPDQKGNAPS